MWYRVLTGMMALAVVCCVAWMVWAGVKIRGMEPSVILQTSESFVWNGESVLSEAEIHRTE